MNKWQVHVKATMAANPGKSLKECLKLAKKTYKKTGAEPKTVKKVKKSKMTKKRVVSKRKTKRRKTKAKK